MLKLTYIKQFNIFNKKLKMQSSKRLNRAKIIVAKT